MTIAKAHRPKVIFAGGSCYPRVIDMAGFRAVADEVGAYLVCDMAHFSGLVAAQPPPRPGAVCRCLHDDRAQRSCTRRARLRWRSFPARRHSPRADRRRGLPRQPGWTADARHRRDGGDVSRLCGRDPAFAERMARTVAGARAIAAAFVDAMSKRRDRGSASSPAGPTSINCSLDTSGGFDAAVGLRGARVVACGRCERQCDAHRLRPFSRGYRSARAFGSAPPSSASRRLLTEPLSPSWARSWSVPSSNERDGRPSADLAASRGRARSPARCPCLSVDTSFGLSGPFSPGFGPGRGGRRW